MIPDPGGVASVLGWTLKKVFAGAGGDLVMAPINAVATSMSNAVGDMLATLGTLWIRLNLPDVWNGGTTGGTVEFLHSEVAPLVGLLAVMGIIVAAARLAWAQTTQVGVELLEGLFIMVVVTGVGVPMIGVLTSGADAWSQSIINDAIQGGDFGRNIAGMLKLTGPTLEPVLVLFFGLVALVVSALMICELAFRSAMLVLLAGLLPVVAALAVMPGGREQVKRYGAWVMALVAWKPIAALIYAAAFRLIGAHDLDSSGIGSILIGLTLMTAAIFALPALLRFLTPTTRALPSGSPATATRTAVMRMPTGARRAVAFTHPATMAMTAGQAAATGVRTATGAATGARNAPTRQENTHP
jgi:type IV secretion system protein TrbL